MTIDDMLSQVAQIKGVARKNTSDTVQIKPSVVHIKEDCWNESILPMGLLTAKELAYCIEKGAEQMGINVAVAVVNSSGRLILLEVMDGSLVASIQAAQDKAYTAAALKMPTDIALRESRGGSLDGLTNGNGILLLGGGYPIEAAGELVGGLGVSGGTKEQDMLLAKIGLKYFSERIKR